jgi:hypothetical protein
MQTQKNYLNKLVAFLFTQVKGPQDKLDKAHMGLINLAKTHG